jgi:hypothetical protein
VSRRRKPSGRARGKPDERARGKPPEERARGGERAAEQARGPDAKQARGRGAPPGPPPPRRLGLSGFAQVLILVAAFGVAVGVAELAGAVSLGVAFGIGQIVFAATLVYLLLRG